MQIIISDVSITRIFPYRLRQDPWDDDGSGPDLHVKLFLNNRNLYSSDTINNVIATDTTLDLILAEEIVLEKSDTNFYVSIYDIDPPDSGIPPIFFFDELFARYRRRNIWRTLAPYEQTTAMFLMSNRAWLSYNIRYIE